MASEKIIVFGPSGQVAAAAACFALEKGAQVALAMRDTKKTVPGLSPEQEQKAGVERIYADLTKPDTVRAAVEQTGAKGAFMYCLFGNPLRPSIEALKAAGIEFVVFNSSAGVRGDLRRIPKSDFIAWEHAQVEIALEEVFGIPNYIAVRGGAFASNILKWKDMVKKGELKVVYPEAGFSYITPEDVGRVCGALLVAGSQVLETKGGCNIVNLTGPNLVSQREAAQVIGKVIGKGLPLVELSEEEGVRFFVDSFGLPESGAKGMVKRLGEMAKTGHTSGEYQGAIYEEAVGNVEKYTGRPSVTLFQWLKENKSSFEA